MRVFVRVCVWAREGGEILLCFLWGKRVAEGVRFHEKLFVCSRLILELLCSSVNPSVRPKERGESWQPPSVRF